MVGGVTRSGPTQRLTDVSVLRSDPIGALAAARAALSGQAAGVPKTRTGPVEAIRCLRVARRGAVKARTQAVNQMHGLLFLAPEQVREALTGLKGPALVRGCAGLRADEHALADRVQATRAALAVIAARIIALNAEIAQADRRVRPVVAGTAAG